MPAPLLDRRAALRVGGVGLFGLGFPEFARAAEASRHKARAKSVILLFQWGGPGQHETFDPKPDAPDNVRGWYKATKTKIPGVIFGEKIPSKDRAWLKPGDEVVSELEGLGALRFKLV